jgi:hypothetical protein
MIVSQYIYTACGKERNGAFSVFSKSGDITNEESAEIREVMMYKTPSGPEFPYEPTEQQIEELFPKKSGYFFLSSGRACLAQVCYIGRVYSELDERFGNYIIHAFVFEKTNDFAPYSFIEHTLFKRMLTKKEWHDDPIPDELPQIEIPENGGMLSMSEVTSFLNEDRKNKLKLFIEAVVNSSNENPFYFFDEQKNHKYWLKILSVCLPKTMQNLFSFCTHFTNTLMPGNISSLIQIRINQPENSLFNYAQEAQKGRYAFDFRRNIMPESVKPGKYAENIVTLLSSGIFEAVKFVDNINKIMSAYPVNINEASDLININKADYSKFENTDEIFNTILIADRVSYETQSIANNLWTKKPQVNFNPQQRLSVLAFIYKNIPAINIRIEIIKTVIDNAEQLGLRVDGADAFNEEIKSKANFIFANYFDYLKAEGLVNYVTRNQNSFLKLFLVFDFLSNLPAVKSSYQTRNYNDTEEIQTVKNIMVSVFKRQSIPDLDLLINSANSHINGLGVELLAVIIKDAVSPGTFITNIRFAFDILQRLRPKTDFARAYLLYLIKTISDKDEFIKVYISAQNNDPDFYTKFENENKHESLIVDFCRKKDVFCFMNQPVNPNILKDYFNKYYITGNDTGLFVKRLGEYLYTVQPEKRINESFNILNFVKLPVNADKTLLPPVYGVVLEAVFSVPYDKIYELCEKQEWLDKINKIYNVIKNAGGSLKQETHELIIITLCGQILEKYGFKEDIQQIQSFFSKEQTDTNSLAEYIKIISSNKSIDTFIEYYFCLVANILIVGATGAKLFNYDGVLEKVFGKIIEKGDLEKITDHIIYGVKKSKAKGIVFILYIFRKHLADSKNTLDKKLGEIAKNYFEKLSAGDRKRTFSELLALTEQTETVQFERYFEEFNKEHKGGFFNLFKNKK